MTTAMNPDELKAFQLEISEGIPAELPAAFPRSEEVSHAPVRKDILTPAEKELALAQRAALFSCRNTSGFGPGVRTRAQGLWPHIHVPIAPKAPCFCSSH